MEKTAVLNWDVEDVLEKLRTEKFDLSVIEAFQREAIDGSSLIALTSDDLKEMNLKLGHKKKVELLIKSFQETLVPSPVATPPVPVLNTQTPPQLEPQASTSFVSSTLAATSSLGASQVTGAPLTTSTSTSGMASLDASNPVSASPRTLATYRGCQKPTFDVIQMVTSSQKGAELYQYYLDREDKLFSVPERRLLVTLIATELVKQCGIFPSAVRVMEEFFHNTYSNI